MTSQDGSLPTLAPLGGDGLQTRGTLIAPLSDAHQPGTTVSVHLSLLRVFLFL